MATGAKASAFAGKWEDIFVIAVNTLDSGKAKMGIATIKKLVNHVHYMWSPISILGLIVVLPYTFQLLIICLY